jgi:hypothetical protein
MGAGTIAEELAATVAHERQRSSESDAASKALVEGAMDLEAVFQMCDSVDAAVSSELLALGYHRPKRDRWRKRRI